MKGLPPAIIEKLKMFLEEDIRSGDITTEALGPLNATGIATVIAKSRTILAGVEEAAAIADLYGITCEVLAFEGNWVGPREPVIRFKGPAKTLLVVERVVLNIVMRMSGIATTTYNMVQSARKENPKVIVAATRKTTPGFRYFEKRAVEVGGGDPHRYALDDMVIIKNNHIAVVGGVAQAIRAARERVSFTKKISCEVRNLQEAIQAAETGVDIVLLDNFTPKEIENVHTVLTQRGLRARVILEASGGIDESNARAFAKSGVDVISSGALTHSYTSSDFSMSLTLA
ncbi:MAG: nicotinate-nucleotide diphosphorylase (carboxylating) [Candidatus Thorarchaeota archaeon]|nr:MAG: nicotinate-nucleotide diphosphorylase (carboxylating) [Candidatus Thorarchaeota archaeon]